MNFSFADLSKQRMMMLGGLVIVIVAMVGFASHFAKSPRHAPVLMLIKTVTLAGRGDLDPLHIVMGQDQHLKDMVDQLSAIPATKVFLDGHDVDMMVASILFRWSGADMAEKGSYSPYIDARVAVFLRRMGMLPASYTPGTEIPIKEAADLNESWYKAFDHYRTLLLAQTAAKGVYDGGVSYDPNADALTISSPVSKTFVAAFQAALQKSADPGESMHDFLTFIDQTKGFDHLSKDGEDLIMSIEVTPHAPSAAGPSVSAPAMDLQTTSSPAPIVPQGQ